MKKHFLILYALSALGVRKTDKSEKSDIVRIAMIDHDDDENERSTPVLTYRLESLDFVSNKAIKEMIDGENQQVLIVDGSKGPPEEKEIVVKPQDLSLIKSDNVKFALTPMQRKIMEMLAEGLQYKEIASILNLSYHTVKNHVSNMYGRMEVSCVGEAIDRFLMYKRMVN